VVAFATVLATAAPATAAPDRPPPVDGTLTQQGVRLGYTIAGRRSPTSPPDDPWHWHSLVDYPVWTGCQPGQRPYITWRIDDATGFIVRFYRLNGSGSGRDPSIPENSLIGTGIPNAYDLEPALDVWFVHVCIGPPTPALEDEIFEALPTPLIGLNPSPAVRGLTGLDTWLWYEHAGDDPEPSIELHLRVPDPANGVVYDVTATAHAGEFVWDMGVGPDGVYASTTPGSPADLPDTAAAIHLYEVKGTYPVTMTVTWTGSYSYPEFTGTNPFADVDLVATEAYPVAEVRTYITR
jgi:hypothetical protein